MAAVQCHSILHVYHVCPIKHPGPFRKVKMGALIRNGHIHVPCGFNKTVALFLKHGGVVTAYRLSTCTHYRHSQGPGELEIPCKFILRAESVPTETLKMYFR